MHAKKLVLIYALELSKSLHLAIGKHMAISSKVFPTAPSSLQGNPKAAVARTATSANKECASQIFESEQVHLQFLTFKGSDVLSAC